MRVELRPAGAGDHSVNIDPELAAGEVRDREGGLDAGTGGRLDGETLRTAAAAAARALRRDGGTVAWQVVPGLAVAQDEQVRAYVEGTAYGAYDPGLLKEGYAGRAEVSLALDAPAELHDLAIRPAIVSVERGDIVVHTGRSYLDPGTSAEVGSENHYFSDSIHYGPQGSPFSSAIGGFENLPTPLNPPGRYEPLFVF